MASASNSYSRYLFEYRHDGSHWGIEIVAASPQDARQRAQAIGWAQYKGEIAANIPASGGHLLHRILARLRN
jgi:hypothetical protein